MNGAKSGVLSGFFLMCLMSALTGELHWTPDAGWREGTGDVGLTAVFVCLPACCCSRSSQTLTSSRRGHCCLGWGPSERLPLSLPGGGQMIKGVMWGHVTLSRRHNLAGCGPFGAVCSRPQPPTPLSFQKLPRGLMWSLFSVFCCRRLSGFAGTPGYLSPEVLRKDPYGKPVDIWACGESSAAAPPPDGADAAV